MSSIRRATVSIASSHSTSRHGSVIVSRTMGRSARSGCVAYPKAKRPFTHEWPSLAPPSFWGTMRTSSSPRSSALNEQPTPQYAQVVITERDGMPSSITDRSWRVAVGHACTQAPQDTHSESMNDSPAPGDTFDSKPRPSMVSANVPWISSQARTQREQTMHLDGSKSKYGFDESVGASRWFSPSPTP